MFLCSTPPRDDRGFTAAAMHRVALKNGSIIAAAARANPAVRGWSVLSRPCAQVLYVWGGAKRNTSFTVRVLVDNLLSPAALHAVYPPSLCSIWSSLSVSLSVSLLSLSVMQRTLSNGPDSAGGRGGGGRSGRRDASAGGQKGVGGTSGAEEGANQPAGRGRGAFSQYLRTHEVRGSAN